MCVYVCVCVRARECVCVCVCARARARVKFLRQKIKDFDDFCYKSMVGVTQRGGMGEWRVCARMRLRGCEVKKFKLL